MITNSLSSDEGAYPPGRQHPMDARVEARIAITAALRYALHSGLAVPYNVLFDTLASSLLRANGVVTVNATMHDK